jgi:hypothetical protein
MIPHMLVLKPDLCIVGQTQAQPSGSVHLRERRCGEEHLVGERLESAGLDFHRTARPQTR